MTTSIASHPKFKEKLPVYRGSIPRNYWDEIIELSDLGNSSKKIVSHFKDTHDLEYSEDSIRTVIRYVRNEKRKALDDKFVENVQSTTKKSLDRLEENYTKMEKLVDLAIQKEDYKLANALQDKVLKALSIQLDIFKDTRDKNKGIADQESPEDLAELKNNLIKKLNLKK